MIRYLFEKEIIILNSLQINKFSLKEQVSVKEPTADNKSSEEFTVSIAAERGIQAIIHEQIITWIKNNSTLLK